MNHIETVAHILDQCRIKDMEVDRLTTLVKKWSDAASKYEHEIQELDLGIKEATTKVFDQIAESSRLKGEIERLKEENAHFAWRDKDKSKLISELAYALGKLKSDGWGHRSDFSVPKLLERAKSLIETKDGMGNPECQMEG